MKTIFSNRPAVSSTVSTRDEANIASRAKGVQDNEAGLRVRLIFWLVKRRLGRIPLSARIRAHDTKLLELAERMSAHTAASGVVAAIMFPPGFCALGDRSSASD